LGAKGDVDVKALDFCGCGRHVSRVATGITAGERKCSRGKFAADCARALRRTYALDVRSFQSLFAGDDLEGNFVAFIQGFESLTGDGRVVHEYILAGILGDEAEAFFIVEPLDFAASHIRS